MESQKYSIQMEKKKERETENSETNRQHTTIVVKPSLYRLTHQLNYHFNIKQQILSHMQKTFILFINHLKELCEIKPNNLEMNQNKI